MLSSVWFTTLNLLFSQICGLTCLLNCFQGLLFLLCALCPPDVSKIRVGKLTPYGIETLRNIRDFLDVKFVIKPDPTTNTVILKCVGCGMKNLSRKVAWAVCEFLHLASPILRRVVWWCHRIVIWFFEPFFFTCWFVGMYLSWRCLMLPLDTRTQRPQSYYLFPLK